MSFPAAASSKKEPRGQGAGAKPKKDACTPQATPSKKASRFSNNLESLDKEEIREKAKGTGWGALAKNTLVNINQVRNIWKEFLIEFAPERNPSLPPGSEDKELLKQFAIAAKKSDYSTNTITESFLNALCSWAKADGLPTLKSLFPGFAFEIKSYLDNTFGSSDPTKKLGLYPPDVRYIMDCVGIDTPANLQTCLIFNLGFISGRRQSSFLSDLNKDIYGIRLGDCKFELKTGNDIRNLKFILVIRHDKSSKNRMFREEFPVTSLENFYSPHNPVLQLGLLLDYRKVLEAGSFAKAVETRKFILKKECADEPLFLKYERTSGKLLTTKGELANFGAVVRYGLISAGYSLKDYSHRSLRIGCCNNIHNRSFRESGNYNPGAGQEVNTTIGWSTGAGTATDYYCREDPQRFGDSTGKLYGATAGARANYFDNHLVTAYNTRLLPENNIRCRHECRKLDHFKSSIMEMETFKTQIEALREQASSGSTAERGLKRKLRQAYDNATDVFLRDENIRRHEAQAKQFIIHSNYEDNTEPVDLARQAAKLQEKSLEKRKFENDPVYAELCEEVLSLEVQKEKEMKFRENQGHGNWKNQGCGRWKNQGCGNCSHCQRKDDCGECRTCKDKTKFGGKNRLRRKCFLKECKRNSWKKRQNARRSQGCYKPRLLKEKTDRNSSENEAPEEEDSPVISWRKKPRIQHFLSSDEEDMQEQGSPKQTTSKGRYLG